MAGGCRAVMRALCLENRFLALNLRFVLRQTNMTGAKLWMLVENSSFGAWPQLGYCGSYFVWRIDHV